jgi:carotenoid 1,2-hydratase
VAPGGYVWWYVDAISDDGQHALTIIAFIGSVFSPYYAAARRLGWNDPENFCAINVALYEPRRNFWALTERPRRDLQRDQQNLLIGPSGLRCNGSTLVIDVNELTVPIPRRLRGTITVTPTTVNNASMTIDAAGRHRWRPFAPKARIAVDMQSPDVQWQGTAYADTNSGDEPLENAFDEWDWSRAHSVDGTIITYDVTTRDGTRRSFGRTLPLTLWRIPRAVRCDGERSPRVLRTLEDTPFYSRSVVETHMNGRTLTAIHESLSLDRVANPLIRCMLPFRMPRKKSHISRDVRPA